MPEEYVGVKFTTVFLDKKFPQDVAHNNSKVMLQAWGRRFFEEGIAPDHAKGGSGNISVRTERGFLITATATRLGFLGVDDFVEVIEYDKASNICKVIGTKEPSSESIMHHLIYEARPDVNAIFHTHDEEVTRGTDRLGIPQTPREMPYGTYNVAAATRDALGKGNVVVMKGHGPVYVGKSMDEAGTLAMQCRKR